MPYPSSEVLKEFAAMTDDEILAEGDRLRSRDDDEAFERSTAIWAVLWARALNAQILTEEAADKLDRELLDELPS